MILRVDSKHKPIMALRALIFIIFLTQASVVLAVPPQQQEVFYHQFEKSDGLLSNIVYDINLNQNGEIIFGTDRGLSIYNGLRFNNRIYAGSSNALHDVYEIGEGAYVGTNFDWEYVIFKKDTTEVLTINKSGLDFPRVIPCGDKKLLYVKSGLVTLDKQDTVHFNSTFNFLYHVVQIDNTTWFTAGDNNRENKLFKLDSNYALVTQNLGFVMTKEDVPFAYNGDLLFYRPTLGGITNLNGKLIQPLPFIPEKVNNLYVNNKNLYFSTLNGLWVFNLVSEKAEHYLAKIQISDTMFDLEGNLWCSSLLHGVFMIPSLTRSVVNFENQLGESLVLQSQQNGSSRALLLSNDSKLFELNYDDYSLSFKKEVQSRNSVEGFLVDSATQTIYLGSSTAEFLHSKNLKTKDKFNLSAIKGFLPSKDKLFIAASSGLYSYHPKKKSVELILPDHRLRGLFKQGNDQYCYSANKLWEIVEEEKPRLVLDGLNIEKVVHNETKTFLLSTTGTVFELVGNKLDPIIQEEGYSNIFLTAKYLFVSNFERADVYDIKNFEKQNSFSNSKGIDTNKLVSVAEFDGQLLFVHQQFMSVFSLLPERNTVQPTIKLLNRDLLPKDLEDIKYAKNDLRFAFGVYPNISAQGKANVRYRIKGLNQEWLPLYATKGSYNIDLLNLADGQYELELMAENEDGISSEAYLIPFSIEPPLWRQNSMLLTYIVLLGAIFWASFYWNRVRLIRKNKAELEKVRLNNQLASAELKAIRSQMNPHFLFNAMTTIQNAILKKDLKDSLDGLSSLSKLLRDVLHKSSMEMHSVQDEIDFLHNYLKLSKKRFGEEFHYEVSYKKEIDTAFEKIPTLITQPFVENAIEHGVSKRKGAKHITINFNKIPQGYQVTIADNGLGSDPSTWYNEEKGSFALKAIENRISRVNKLSKLKVGSTISSASEGTTVTLTFENEQ